MSELTLQEAALAWAQGKRVEAIGPSNAWGLIQEVGSSEGMWQPGVFSGDSSRVFRFRLAPKPPAKKWRPYTRDEIGKYLGGAVLRKDQGFSALITVVLEEAVGIGISHYTFQDLLNGFTWLDGSPCGVEVEA